MLVTYKTEQLAPKCTFGQVDVHLTCETDIVLHLPSGKQIVVQYRLEGPTLDVCFPHGEEVAATNWLNDMQDAPKISGAGQHERLVDQVCFGIDPKWVEPKADDPDVCPDGTPHTPDWNSVNIQHDGDEVYIDINCLDCGRSGCIGNRPQLEEHISW